MSNLAVLQVPRRLGEAVAVALDLSCRRAFLYADLSCCRPHFYLLFSTICPDSGGGRPDLALAASHRVPRAPGHVTWPLPSGPFPAVSADFSVLCRKQEAEDAEPSAVLPLGNIICVNLWRESQHLLQ